MGMRTTWEPVHRDTFDVDQPCDGPTAAESNPYRQETDR